MTNQMKKYRKPRKRQKSSKSTDIPVQKADIGSDFIFQLNTAHLLVLTFITAAIYFGYSYLSEGFYQHDEASHFLSMRGFWHDPNSILGIWHKPGFKLVYIIPALLGPKMVLIINCLITAFCCALSYRISEKIGSKIPVLSFILLAFQPFWLQLSFRTYSEPLSALLLLIAVYYHLKEKPLYTSLALSYMLLIRYELYTMVGLYGLYLLYKKKIVPMCVLALFPLLNHIWGWIVTGDALFLFHILFGTMNKIQAAYSSAAMGFSHFPKMSLTVYGPLIIVFFLVYLGQALFYKQKLNWVVLLAFAFPFLQLSIFQIRSVTIGPSGAGNLRAIVPMAPFLAILATVAVDRLTVQKEKKKLFILLFPYALIVLIFLKYKHNNLTLTHEIDIIPVVTTGIALALVSFPLKKKEFLIFLSICTVGFALLTVKPMKLSPEDLTVKHVVRWAKMNKLEKESLLVNHSLFFYFYGKTKYDFPIEVKSITKQNIEQSQEGTFILWDSHYSYRPNQNPDHVKYTYFHERKDTFKQIHAPFITPDRRFGLFIYQKLTDD